MGSAPTFSCLLAKGIPACVRLILSFSVCMLTRHKTSSHTTLELTKVNTYGLVYVWKGSDPTLKPLLLAAHQGLYTMSEIFTQLD